MKTLLASLALLSSMSAFSATSVLRCYGASELAVDVTRAGKDFRVIILDTRRSKRVADFVAVINNKGGLSPRTSKIPVINIDPAMVSNYVNIAFIVPGYGLTVLDQCESDQKFLKQLVKAAQ